MAHRALRDVEFLGGAREAPVPRRGVERPQRIQRWQGAAHSAPLYMNKIRSGPRNVATGTRRRHDNLCCFSRVNWRSRSATERGERLLRAQSCFSRTRMGKVIKI